MYEEETAEILPTNGKRQRYRCLFPFDKKIKNCYEIYAKMMENGFICRSVVAGTAAGSTGMTVFMMVVMFVIGTFCVRIVIQCTVEIRFYVGVRIAFATAEMTDSYAGQCVLCTTADTSAEEKLYSLLTKEYCQRFVTKITGIENFSTGNFIVFYIVKLELLCVAKMLKNLTIVVSYSDFHNHTSCCQMYFTSLL